MPGISEFYGVCTCWHHQCCVGCQSPACGLLMQSCCCSHLHLCFGPQVQDLIKGASNLTGWNLDSHQRGMASLRAYTSSGDCRHAALVNFFQPGTLPPEGPCAGGCDNCNRRWDADCQHWGCSAGGTHGCAGEGQHVQGLKACLLLTILAAPKAGLLVLRRRCMQVQARPCISLQARC